MLWNDIKVKFSDFEISENHLSRVIRENNIIRKRTRIRHYPLTRYGKPIDFKKEMKQFFINIDKFINI